jgi:signal peptidase II
VPRSRHESTESFRGLFGPGGGKLRLVAAVTVVVVGLDAVTKQLAIHNLAGQGRTELLGGLIQFQFYRNFAGPNNLFGGHTVLISVFAIVAVFVLLLVAFRVASTAGAVAVGLLLGGAIGNLVDRLVREPGPLRGGVIDWLKLTSLSKSMNVADLAIDAAIVVMVAALALNWWRNRKSGQNEPPSRGASVAP